MNPSPAEPAQGLHMLKLLVYNLYIEKMMFHLMQKTYQHMQRRGNIRLQQLVLELKQRQLQIFLEKI